ncbi:hypothetical protein CEXT_694991 [Caerostris extrusa]|uniref:Uncharacterized protein n=1 Tax=Caerostris extrusa TaxID=172846 RepID=A0AAV4MJL3_CAEEX|nr:hypothetical protein CEXT_694991 [Caerostris extrusa]
MSHIIVIDNAYFDYVIYTCKLILFALFYLSRLFKVAEWKIFANVRLNEQSVDLSRSQEIDDSRDNADNEMPKQFPPFCELYGNGWCPGGDLVRKAAVGVDSPPSQSITSQVHFPHK